MKELLGNAGLIALLGTIFGGVGLKVVESWLGRAKERSAESASIREELRMEITNLREQLSASDKEEKRLEALVDEWRNKYYDLRDEKQRVVTELTIVMERLKTMEGRIDPPRG